VVFTNKYGGITVTHTSALVFHSRYVSVQTGHHQVIREIYINDDGIHIKLILALWFYLNSVTVCIFLTLSSVDGLSWPKYVVSGTIKMFVGR
jgi:hypothetical protein